MEGATLMTKKQAARIERNRLICEAFVAVRNKYPTASLERIFEEVGKDYKLTNCSIRAIVKREGLC